MAILPSGLLAWDLGFLLMTHHWEEEIQYIIGVSHHCVKQNIMKNNVYYEK